MCRRYRLLRPDLLAGAFSAVPPFDQFTEMGKAVRLRFKPGDYVLIVHLRGRRRVIDVAHWGFVPSWAGGDGRVKPIHARSETAADSGMFCSAFQSWRCLIPADGFYDPGGPQRYFQRPDGGIFAFAGLWSYRDDSQTCVLLTTAANRVVAPFHSRMPVIISPADYRKWLDPKTDPSDLQQLLRPTREDELAVESDVNQKRAERTLFEP